MYQVVASDLDGTCLSPDPPVSPAAKETLQLRTARGIDVVFATRKPLYRGLNFLCTRLLRLI